ncbi:MAG: HAMP domain-containing histidine kinase [Saprospiraceae bacterium]|nr:HAMP domain-containing histidine kinase [Saprospiraceae bacterium]
MKLSRRILLYFSTSIIAFIGLALWLVYLFFADYRREEFWRRLTEEGEVALRMLAQADSAETTPQYPVDFMDDADDERMLIFDRDRRVYYNSLGNKRHYYHPEMLNALSKSNPDLQGSEQGVAIKGLYREQDGREFYIITRASDQFGMRKQEYLRYLLLGTFVIACVLVVLISHYLARQITAPLEHIAKQIEQVRLDTLQKPLDIPSGSVEVQQLALKFNAMRERLDQAVKFQSHFIQHVSHELKTPLAVLFSNLERAEATGNETALRQALLEHKTGLRDVADILDALLQIAQVEAGAKQALGQPVRIDELLFQVMDSLRYAYDDLHIEVALDESITDAAQLTVTGNRGLLHAVLQNLLKNAHLYHREHPPTVALAPLPGGLRLTVCNDGPTLPPEEAERLFQHFFRGSNSSKHSGFGLGLALAHHIVALHGGQLWYEVSEQKGWNCFQVELRL